MTTQITITENEIIEIVDSENENVRNEFGALIATQTPGPDAQAADAQAADAQATDAQVPDCEQTAAVMLFDRARATVDDWLLWVDDHCSFKDEGDEVSNPSGFCIVDRVCSEVTDAHNNTERAIQALSLLHRNHACDNQAITETWSWVEIKAALASIIGELTDAQKSMRMIYDSLDTVEELAEEYRIDAQELGADYKREELQAEFDRLKEEVIDEAHGELYSALSSAIESMAPENL